MAEETSETESLIYQSEDFSAVYSNNVQFETTVFDMTAMFGELVRKGDGGLRIEQHTSVTMSWMQAKLAAIFFALNVAAHEEANGPIVIHKAVLPEFIELEKAGYRIDDLLKELIEKAARSKKEV